MFKCVECGSIFVPEEEYLQAKLCHHCFEEALAEYEIEKRERIARQNEY